MLLWVGWYLSKFVSLRGQKNFFSVKFCSQELMHVSLVQKKGATTYRTKPCIGSYCTYVHGLSTSFIVEVLVRYTARLKPPDAIRLSPVLSQTERKKTLLKLIAKQQYSGAGSVSGNKELWPSARD